MWAHSLHKPKNRKAMIVFWHLGHFMLCWWIKNTLFGPDTRTTWGRDETMWKSPNIFLPARAMATGRFHCKEHHSSCSPAKCLHQRWGWIMQQKLEGGGDISVNYFWAFPLQTVENTVPLGWRALTRMLSLQPSYHPAASTGRGTGGEGKAFW